MANNDTNPVLELMKSLLSEVLSEPVEHYLGKFIAAIRDAKVKNEAYKNTPREEVLKYLK